MNLLQGQAYGWGIVFQKHIFMERKLASIMNNFIYFRYLQSGFPYHAGDNNGIFKDKLISNPE